MENEIFEVYILVYPDGKPVGIDSGSGGYPYPIESFYNNNLKYCWISRVELFPTEERAQEYQKHFRELTIKKVRFKIEAV